MMNVNPQQFLQRALQNNPQIANSPEAQQIIQVLMSGDAQRGQEMAQNYCKSYGVTPDQAMGQAQNFFKQNFHF